MDERKKSRPSGRRASGLKAGGQAGRRSTLGGRSGGRSAAGTTCRVELLSSRSSFVFECVYHFALPSRYPLLLRLPSEDSPALLLLLLLLLCPPLPFPPPSPLSLSLASSLYLFLSSSFNLYPRSPSPTRSVGCSLTPRSPFPRRSHNSPLG